MGLVVGPTDVLAEISDLARREAAVQGAAPVRGRAPFEPWHTVGAVGEPSFATNFYSVNGGYNPVGYCRTPSGIVLLRGLVGVTNYPYTLASAFTLPAGYRPAFGLAMNTMGWDDGTLSKPGGPAPTGASYFDGQVFVAASGMVMPDLPSTQQPSASEVAFRLRNGWFTVDNLRFRAA